MSPTLATVLALLGVLFGGGGGAWALWTVRATRNKLVADAGQTVAETVQVLLGSATDLVAPLKLELAEARAQAVGARAEIAEVRSECVRLERKMHRLVEMIHDPYMDLDRLRLLMPLPPDNGIR